MKENIELISDETTKKIRNGRTEGRMDEMIRNKERMKKIRQRKVGLTNRKKKDRNQWKGRMT